MGETIGWIGVGSIGHRMAKHLANAGYSLVVADAGSTERAPEGSKIAKSNAEVAASAETIILSLPDGKISVLVAKEIAAAPNLKAKTVIDTSTIGIGAAEEAAAVLAAVGVQYIDAPVSGGIAGADKATLSVMLACPEEHYERFKPLMAHMGKPFHIGPRPGQGQAVKLLNNFLSAAAQSASCEAIAFGVKQGIPMAKILEVVNVSTGRNTATDDKFPRRIINEAYDAGFTAALQAKDVNLYLENARKSGISDEVATAVLDVWKKFEKDWPGADITHMYPYTRDGRVPPKKA
jgi:3-hydroxyisobutyrate dehydrogenase-like beta-hydroxyacid dehydrogenase